MVPRRRGGRAPLSAPRSAGTPRSWCTARSAPASASAATSRPTPRRPRCTRSGFNHFFRGKDHPGGGDQVFFQGHASPGMYARAFLEGRLTEDQLDGFRQEQVARAGGGLPSYPHPRLMPDFWEFPTVSMGLGPMNAIYQAQFNKYLHNRGIKDTSRPARVGVPRRRRDGRARVAAALLQLAADEELDNLTFVVNCNLQRLDGPVRGNGKIIQELEAFFRGAGWNVIKVVWGRELGPAARRRQRRRAGQPDEHHPRRRLPDLQGQRRRLRPRALLRPRPAHRKTGRGLDRRRDLERSSAAATTTARSTRPTSAATEHNGQPTVILAKTIKGYGLGSHFEGRNATHQMKKLTLDDLKDLPRPPAASRSATSSSRRDPYLPPYYHPGADDDAHRVPARAPRASSAACVPAAAHRSTPPVHAARRRGLRRRSRRARASRRSPRRWRSCGCSRT